MIDFQQEEQHSNNASIKVIGVGGAGGNTINRLMASGCQGIECIVANTDAQVLTLSKADQAIHIGVKSTKGLGSGANPELGKRAAEEDLDNILESVGQADIVFLTGGMGGGTGSGALPVIAKALRERQILTIAIVTKPFVFEGKRRAQVAQKAIDAIRKEVDTLIVIPNQKLLEIVDAQVSMVDAFDMINEILSKSVKGISDIITKPGHINVDFADVRTIMKDMGLAVMGTGSASGKDRAAYAAMQAISSPLLENVSVKGARGVLLNITGGKNLTLHEISQAAEVIYEQAHEDATIILGSVIDESMTDQVTVTIIATGFTLQDTVVVPAAQAVAESKIMGSVLDVLSNDAVDKGTVDVQKSAHEELQLANQADAKDESELFVVASQADYQELPKPARQESQKTVELDKSHQLVDDSDLDVPAFMRAPSQQKVKAE